MKAKETRMQQTKKSRSTTRSGRNQKTAVATRRTPTTKAGAAVATTRVKAPAKTSGAPLTDEQVLALARSVVPKRLHGRERLVRHETGPVRAGITAERDTASEVAKLVGAKMLPPADEATVEFPEMTSLGKRDTVVHVRDGKVTNVIKRARK
jgi:hypothetical protein